MRQSLFWVFRFLYLINMNFNINFVCSWNSRTNKVWFRNIWPYVIDERKIQVRYLALSCNISLFSYFSLTFWHNIEDRAYLFGLGRLFLCFSIWYGATGFIRHRELKKKTEDSWLLNIYLLYLKWMNAVNSKETCETRANIN